MRLDPSMAMRYGLIGYFCGWWNFCSCRCGSSFISSVYIEKRIYRCAYDIHVLLGDDQIKCHKSWSNAKRSIIVLRVKRHVALHFKKYIQIIYLCKIKIIIFAFFAGCSMLQMMGFCETFQDSTPLNQYKTTRIASAGGKSRRVIFFAACLMLLKIREHLQL